MSISESMTMEYDLKMTDQARRGLNEEQLALWNTVYGPIYEEYKRSNPDGDELVRFKHQRYLKDYLSCVAAVDKSVGELLDYLEDSGLAENTLVVYTSDQGFYLGEHGWFDKRWMYEESLKTPLLMQWPKVIKAGSVNTDLVSNLDFGQTFIDLAGADIPEEMQGRSLLPVLKGNTPADWRKEHYYHYYEHPSEHYVMRHYGIATGRYKLIHFYYDMDAWELYDLEEDPMEMQNLYDDPAYEEVREDLHQRLEILRDYYGDNDSLNNRYIEEYHEKVKKNPLIEYWKFTPEERQELFRQLQNRNED